MIPMGRGSETIAYGYDGHLRVSETLEGTLGQSLAYHYAVDGLAYGGETTSYTYDDDDLLTGSGRFAISRNAGNGLPESVSGNGLDGQESRVGGVSQIAWTLTRDAAGRIESKTETVGGAATVFSYGYD
jgi:hypothetical protein